MTSHQHDFQFDANYALGNDSVFTLVDLEGIEQIPPILGYFLEFQGGGVPFLLLNGTFMTLL